MMTIGVKFRRYITKLPNSMTALALVVFPAGVFAQESHSHTPPAQQESVLADSGADTLLKVVRQSTERFKDVSVAKAEGYALQFGCVTGDDDGAMGIHYVNGDLVNKGELDATRPQIVIYEPMPGGGLRLIGADYLVIADAWNAKHSSPPELMGQFFHLFTTPNRFEIGRAHV